MRYRVIMPPAIEPLTLDEVRLHVRVDLDLPGDPDADPVVPPSSSDDPGLLINTSTAREWVEAFTGRWLTAQTIEVAFDSFYEDLELGWPLQSVESIKYVDQAGVEQTLAPEAFSVDTYRRPARLAPIFGTTWPFSRAEANAVKVVAIVGPAEDEPTPSSLRSAMLLCIGELFEKRGAAAEMPSSAAALAWPYRIGLGL